MQKATRNMNNIKFVKYDYIPEKVEIKSIVDREYREV